MPAILACKFTIWPHMDARPHVDLTTFSAAQLAELRVRIAQAMQGVSA